MKKNLSYREKLLELSYIYRINEVKDYIKRKKNLTTSQIEHILKKNNVPIPKEIHVGFIEKNFTRRISKIEKNIKITNKNINYNIFKFFSGAWKNLGNIGIGFLETIPRVGNAVFNILSEAAINSLNAIYNTRVHEKKTNKIVANAGIAFFILAIGIISFTVFGNFESKKTLIEDKKIINKLSAKQEEKVVKNIKPEKKIKQKAEIKNEIKKLKKSKQQIAKLPKKEEKKPSQVSGLVLPNLNLKTETVLSLFEDVKYDLKTVRYQKRVKPIYFTQFPKDLDEIKDVKLKKETFIKIVLPLVVAENEKILDDRNKLKRILSSKMTTEKQKLWLKQKLREYKVKNLDIKELEQRMDIIPVSIALAQAAKESGWGTSRFALEGNAIFGQWTWTGKGIEPLNRGEDQVHKILRFPILRASVKAYKNNLNTHKGYKDFRSKRSSLRKKNRNISGLVLTKSLDKYAQTGKEYTDILEKIIKQNDLDEFESVQLTNSEVKHELNL